MNEEAAFIAALVAEPSDRTAALVFADWLDERGDPRGPWLRIDAVRAWMAPKYGNPIPDLIAALTVGKRVTDASKALALIGEPAIPELTTLLSHQLPSVRSRAVKTLRMMGARAKSALPALMAMVKDTDYTVRSEAALAMKELARRGVVEKTTLQEALQNQDPTVRSQAASLLGTMRAKRSATKELAKGLDSPDPAERLAAVEAMGKLSTTTAADAFCKALADPAVEIRRTAAFHLRRLASETMTGAIEPLRKALADDDKKVRDEAVGALFRIGPAAGAAVPDLLRLLTNAGELERYEIFKTIARVGVGHPESLEVVLAAVNDPSQPVREVARLALPRWPSLPASAAPVFLELARTPNTDWKSRTIIQSGLRSLARIANPPPEVLDVFRALLSTDDSSLAGDVLKEGGPVVSALLPELIAAFKPGTNRLQDIAKALGKIGGEGIAALVRALDAEPVEGRYTMAAVAAMGLKEAGSAALSVLPELLTRLRERTDSVVRACLVDAITAMGPEVSSAVPDMIALFDGPMTPDLSRTIFQALQTFPAAVLPFVPRLTEMLRQPGRASLHGQLADLLTALIPHGVDAFPAFRDLLRQALAGEMYRSMDLTGAFRFAVARAAIKGLTALGSVAAETLPDMTLAYQTFGDPELRDMREEILEAYGAIGAAAVPHIRPALTDSIWKIRLAAFDALGTTGDTSAETLDALRAGETDASRKVRTRVAAILRKMDSPKPRRK